LLDELHIRALGLRIVNARHGRPSSLDLGETPD
jgi:hypothetical protein